MGKRDINNFLTALRADTEKIAVYSNSWSYISGGRYDSEVLQLLTAIDEGTKRGFGGKGSSYVFASGNNSLTAMGSNAFSAHHAVIAVSGVRKNGKIHIMAISAGLSHWISAFTSEITTSDNTDSPSGECGKVGDYTHTFGGTSAATPMVAGVVALIRQANDKLTYRDVKLILAETAKTRKDILTDDYNWQTTGPTYTDPTQNYHYSEILGFGMLDAYAAVKLAKTWQPLPQQKIEEHASSTKSFATKENQTTEIEITIKNSAINFVEFVQLSLDFRSKNSTPATVIMVMTITDPSGRDLNYYTTVACLEL